MAKEKPVAAKDRTEVKLSYQHVANLLATHAAYVDGIKISISDPEKSDAGSLQLVQTALDALKRKAGISQLTDDDEDDYEEVTDEEDLDDDDDDDDDFDDDEDLEDYDDDDEECDEECDDEVKTERKKRSK